MTYSALSKNGQKRDLASSATGSVTLTQSTGEPGTHGVVALTGARGTHASSTSISRQRGE
eukprot:CAMPEP_0185319102 /NCGR_PEP_ID=MMETSP1363-20130426/51304_1 /TAXON_ID=38817 /ORGANISM="Gephyrocapsa oceanica, Strain RCC1303" /LENGTH=59 /DNA_ID=CAMNT_0027917435 /DNA_START=27 /DNA_END=203 /DNA_ORIENTATION=-